MEAIIQNSVSIIKNCICISESNYSSIMFEFNLILDRICNSENETQLRSKIKLDDYQHFLIGFGGSHMWAKQIIDGDPKQQVIFVPFTADCVHKEYRWMQEDDKEFEECVNCGHQKETKCTITNKCTII